MITLSILLFGIASFIILFSSHILIWRIRKPSRHMAWLSVIFIIFPVLIYTLINSWVINKDIIFIALWNIALSVAYVMSYPAIQAECPTLKIILAVLASMPKGMTFKAINEIFSHNKLFSDRIEDLVKDHLILPKGDRWDLSFKGRLIVRFFSIYRSLLGLPLGEG